MSNIRVTYSGIIALIVSFSGIIIGTIFVVIVTRRLQPEELGIWTLIGSLVTYVAIIEPVINTWSTRQIARGEQVGKTALYSSGFFSAVGVLCYGGIAIYVSYSLGADFNILFLASALIPLSFLNNSLNAICLGFRPQAVSYGRFAFEISKLPLGIIFVIFWDLGIVGAILTVVGASSIRLIILFELGREQIIGSIKLQFLKFWLRTSWLTIYMSLAGFLRSLDVLIFSLLTNSIVGLAYWGVGLTISSRVGTAGTISQGLYPKLLATGKKEFAEENLKIVMYFAIPFLGASVVFAKPLLHILNPIYIDGVTIVLFLALRAFVTILMDIFFGVLKAYEKVDIDKQASFKQFVRSRLFFLSTLNYILYGSYIVLLVIVIILFYQPENPDWYIVTWWSFVFLIVTIPFMIYGLVAVKKYHGITFPIKETSKFGGATLFSGIIVFYFAENFLVYSQSIWDFLPQILPIIAFGGGIYFGITYLIDKSTRKLFNSIFSQLGKR